jgi:hypothetical protein
VRYGCFSARTEGDEHGSVKEENNSDGDEISKMAAEFDALLNDASSAALRKR